MGRFTALVTRQSVAISASVVTKDQEKGGGEGSVHGGHGGGAGGGDHRGAGTILCNTR